MIISSVWKDGMDRDSALDLREEIGHLRVPPTVVARPSHALVRSINGGNCDECEFMAKPT
jgi:hypothetical protein